MSTVFVTLFNDKTETEARIRFATNNLVCGHRCRTSVKPDDLILMINFKSHRVVGVARAASACLDTTITVVPYTLEDTKYNRYAILIKDLVLFDHTVSLATLRHSLGVDEKDKSPTNIFKGFPNSWQPAFIKSENQPIILARLHGWIEGRLTA